MAMSYARAGASGIAILDILDSSSVEKDLLQAATAAGRSQPHIICLKVDITNLAAVEKAAETIKAKFQTLDILINNAGFMAPYTPIGQSDPEKWWRSWEVNIRGSYHVTRSFLPILLKGQDKTIIVVSSAGAHHTFPGGSAYETTKFASLKINNYLLAEYSSQGLLVYAIAPGAILTDMAKEAFPEEYYGLLTDKPQLVADTLTFLTKERRDWLAGRYIDAKWDMEQLLGKKDAIIDDDLLKVELRT